MNPLVADRFVNYVLFDVVKVEELCALPAFADHSRATFEPWLDANRRLARESLAATWRPMDEAPPTFEGGRVLTHPAMPAAWRQLVELGVLAATRPPAVGGQQLPLTVATLSSAYLMAANLSAYGFAGLTSGAAHLIEAFGTDEVKALFVEPMYSGRWSGTMALTEPHAGSSLGDLTSRASPLHGLPGRYSISGSKLFISGGDQNFTENIVHLVLARIDGAPAGTKGISLFAVPKRRPGTLEANDVHVSGVIHKIGWRGLPSVGLSFGDAGRCEGYLVGAPNQGLRCMFQMMNEARIMVGVNAAATASVAYHESLAWAQERRQGRALGQADQSSPMVPLFEHPDVRRMLLRQKAIVEGSLALLAMTAKYADLAEHAVDPQVRERSKLVLDVLTPVAKTFPSERGYEANALALQIHGGYGYSSEYPVEGWLRDQKLNSIHEGTTSIQSLDLLGRKVVAAGGSALAILRDEVLADVEEAEAHGPQEGARAVREGLERWVLLTATLGAHGARGAVEDMLGHSFDYYDFASTLIIGWVWLKLVTTAHGRDDDFAKGLRAAGQYWFLTELPRLSALASRCESLERSYLDVRPGWLEA